ncbi:MAG: DUF3866 family protein [Candidatus Zipacnadales bacterium]
MVNLRQGCVVAISLERKDIQFLDVELDAELHRAVCYPPLTGPCAPADEVLLNTTAVVLGLGTGGYHFVVANLTRPEHASTRSGHIMKLRYSPLQVRVQAGGEEDAELRAALGEGASLADIPVIVLPLHSMIPAAAVAFAETSGHKLLVYLMTDSAALPLAFSNTVVELRERHLLSATVTAGHAFGGDIEAVGLYDGLLLAAHLARNGAVVTAPGPGIVGTSTAFGTTALEQGQIVNAVAALRGYCIVAPRLSLTDERLRHRGLSHHTVTALQTVALASATIAMPDSYPDLLAQVHHHLPQHHIVHVDASRTREWLARYGLKPCSMGRTVEQDPVLFEAGAAAGILAAETLGNA